MVICLVHVYLIIGFLKGLWHIPFSIILKELKDITSVGIKGNPKIMEQEQFCFDNV